MFPIRLAIPTRYPPLVTWALIAVNTFIFLVQTTLSPAELEVFLARFALIPAAYFQPVFYGDGALMLADYLPFVTNMFLHGGWLHLIVNMWTLWLFGPTVEDRLGHGRYLAFYLVCGLVASLAQVYAGPDSILPSLGASGAIAGVLAGYLVLFPTNRVRVLLGYFITTVPAVAMIGLWALIQFFNGFAATSVSAQTGGVAYMAHIGGFIAGLVLAFVLKPFSDRGIGPHVVGYPRRGTFS